MGVALAWVLVRFRFPGRNVLSSLVDLPLAIPTLVTGLMIATLYGPNGAIGKALDAVGLQVVFTPIGILLALCVVTLLEATTEPPPDALDWRRIETHGFLVFVPRAMRLPKALELRVRGRMRRRIDALWDGCAYVI